MLRSRRCEGDGERVDLTVGMELERDKTREKEISCFCFSTPVRFVQVFLCFLCTWVSYVERQGFSISYTAIASHQNTPESVKGVVLSAFYYGYASSQVPGGWIASKIGGWKVLQLSHVIWGLCSALTPTVVSLVFNDKPFVLPLLFARVMVGLAQGAVIPSIHTVLSQWIPVDEKARAVSFTTSGLYLGSATAMAVFPSVITSLNPESIPLISATMAFSWICLTFIFAREPIGDPLGISNNALKSHHSTPLPLTNQMKDKDDKEDVLEGIHPGSSVSHSRTTKGSPNTVNWSMMLSRAAVWAIVTNNFTFHYAFYVVMNWLPTFIHSALKVELSDLGSLKIAPYVLMFLVSNLGGIVGDYLVTKKSWNVGVVRKLINTIGFVVATIALLLIPSMKSVTSSLMMTSLAVSGCAFARGGFSVNHMDIGPKYAGIIMGISNCAGTISGVIGVSLSGIILDSFGGASSMTGWAYVFGIPAILNIIGAVHFCIYARGDRIFN